MLPNPLVPGFNPDPSVVRADGAYYLVTSTFEYLPGIPVYRSTDLVGWTQVGNVATRPEQVGVADVPTGGGVWAPTIRYRDGVFYVIVTIAQGGTERGHGVSIARGPSPEGPFEAHPANPVLSARSTSRPIQNTGHADLVETPDGGWALVLLGMRPLGATQAFSPLGRETFGTPVSWVDGWPHPSPVELAPRNGDVQEAFDFADPSALDDPGWLAVRTTPGAVASVVDGRLVVAGRVGLDDPRPQFVGRRQRHLTTTVSTRVDASAGVGGLAVRYDENHWFALEARAGTVTARAHLAGLAQSWPADVPGGEVELRIETAPAPVGFIPEAMGGDRIRLLAGDRLLAELDGRYWTAETCASFTGRVVGLYAAEGTVAFADFRYSGR